MGPYYSSLGRPVGWQNSPPARVLTEFSHQEGEAPLPAENRAHLYWRATPNGFVSLLPCQQDKQTVLGRFRPGLRLGC